MSQVPNFDINQLMKSAQQIAQSIPDEEKENISNMNMDQMFDHITTTVFNTMEQNGRQIDPATKNQMKVMSKAMMGQVMESVAAAEPKDSKIDENELASLAAKVTGNEHKIPQKDTRVEEIDDDDDVPELCPRMDDIYYNLPVSLEEIYHGKTKKLKVKRDRLDKSGKKVKSEHRKIEIPVPPGTHDGQEIRFNREGDEKPGYESGDIVITLTQTNHSYFERHGSTLYTVKNISLYESYAAGLGLINLVLKHLDGSYMILKVEDGIPLHAKDGSRKVKGAGMPIYNPNNRTNEIKYGDLYIRFNVILPEKFEDSKKAIELIEQLFPKLKDNEDSIMYRDPNYRKGGFSKSGNSREVVLEEVTEEDKEQLDYDEEYSEESESEESESEESEEEESEEEYRRKNRRR